MTKQDVGFIIGFFIMLPFVLYFGFWLTFQFENNFITPQFQHYGLPLRTDFWGGQCQIFAEIEYKNEYGDTVKETAWRGYRDYESYLNNKNWDENL